MTRSVGIDQHPDIVEMRARYEAAGQTPIAQGVDGLIALTGLFLAVSPWIVGFNGLTAITVNNLITGIALSLLAAGFASAYGRTYGMAWVVPVIGLWTVVAPWAIRGDMANTRTIWSNAVAGGIAIACGLAAMGVAMLRRK
ncbi:SPW repeat protein [Actinomadura roseirufa]|uniref:SPW repeat protein n=1 Tax=Actinomadura roseirufa TaxID=2094049 RepID=UPI0010414280|nr:SPW repeat protein [Actinomadura roseirufa]